MCSANDFVLAPVLIIKAFSFTARYQYLVPHHKEKSYTVSGDKIQGVWMKPGWTHNIINLSDTEELLTVMWASEMLDKNRPDTFYERV